MTEEEYKELNMYLNDTLETLKYDFFFLENIELFKEFNNRYCEIVEKYDINVNYSSINLSDDKTFSLAYKIIESISPNYLELFNQLKENKEIYLGKKLVINNGAYEITDSNTFITPNIKLIFVKKDSNYSDVKEMIHEFIHYISYNDRSIKRYILDDFLPIYFEQYAEEYLKKQGITDESINSNNRIMNTYNRCSQLSWMIDPLVIFSELKEININQIDYINENIMKISKEDLEEQCRELLNFYREHNKNESNGLVRYNYFHLNFEYLFNTLLAFYATKHCKVEDMIYLNEHISDDNGKFIIDTLEEIGIDLSDDKVIDEMFNCIEEYLQKQNNKVIK